MGTVQEERSAGLAPCAFSRTSLGGRWRSDPDLLSRIVLTWRCDFVSERNWKLQPT
jgi:hypothetical protein